jgi:hypothetical protein
MSVITVEAVNLMIFEPSVMILLGLQGEFLDQDVRSDNTAILRVLLLEAVDRDGQRLLDALQGAGIVSIPGRFPSTLRLKMR